PGAAAAHHRSRSHHLQPCRRRDRPAWAVPAWCRAAAERGSSPSAAHNAPEHLTLLRERFSELGMSARRFLDGLLRDQRCGKNQARRVLALLGTYARKDLLAALDRAVRFGAYSAQAVERILAAPASPKSVLE